MTKTEIKNADKKALAEAVKLSRVFIASYRKANGTWVAAHTRAYPNCKATTNRKAA